MILDRFKLTDRVAIVTGAGRGIGRGIAAAFAEAGADVVCAARTAEQLETLAEEILAGVRRTRRQPIARLASRSARCPHLLRGASPCSSAEALTVFWRRSTLSDVMLRGVLEVLIAARKPPTIKSTKAVILTTRLMRSRV